MHDTVIDALMDDHRQLEQCLRDMLDTRPSEAAARVILAVRLQSMLMPHTYGEENGLYRLLKRFPRARLSVLTAAEEHHVVRLLLDELLGVPAEHESWSAKVSVLAGLLRQHMRTEEREAFDEARALLSSHEMDEAMRLLEEERQAGPPAP
jgi:hypothetical protein